MPDLKLRSSVLIAVLCLLILNATAHYAFRAVNGVGVANVVVTSVYWGSDPMKPATAHPGDINVQISVVLSNVGDDVARNVNATLLIAPPVIYNYYLGVTQISATAISKIAGDMSAGQSFTVAFVVSVDPNAKDGIYRYDLQLSYKSARELQQINTDTTIDVPIWKGELHVQNIVTLPTKIYPDSKQVVVKVFIVNSGQGEAKDLQLKLDLAAPFSASSSGSDSIYVGNIAPAQSSEADFIVDVAADAKFGQYNVALGEQTTSGEIPIGLVPLYVAEKVQFNIVSVTPTEVHSGDSGDVISVQIMNTGSVKADSVRVELRVGNFFTGTLTDFLGTMLAGETKTAFFTVDIDSKALPGQYVLDLRFDWTQDNNSLDHTQSITLTVSTPGFPTALIVVAVVIIGGGGGYFYLRRRRAKTNQTSKK